MKRITIKIGTRVLTASNNKIDEKVIANIVDSVVNLRESGKEVVIVTSGAIGAGLGLFGTEKKHKSLSELQALASVGQNHLMNIYNKYLKKKGYVAGQILLTQDDFNDRKRFLNIKYTINTLLKYKAIPVINENDSVSTEEIKCGDNDRLSYLVSDLISSDTLIILTDVEGLFDADGKIVKKVEKIDKKVLSFCKTKVCNVSTGGMHAKLASVKDATTAGIRCFIVKGKEKNIIADIVSGKNKGTAFLASGKKLNARKRWIGYSMKSKGEIIVDDGALSAVKDKNKSLLPSGVVSVKGKFFSGELVEITSIKGEVIAKGLTNYNVQEIDQIKGVRTDRVEGILGYKDYDEIVHRDNLVILDRD